MTEYDWEEEEVDNDEQEQQEQEQMTTDQAFATPYHSHVGEVPDLNGDTVPPLHSMVSDTEVSEDQWTEENGTDVSGLTRTPNSPVPRQSDFPSEPARLAAEAIMQTTFPNLIAEINPDWAPLTAQDLLDNADSSSNSPEFVTSEEEPDEDGYSTNSEDGYPDIQRVMTYPARLTEEVQRKPRSHLLQLA